MKVHANAPLGPATPSMASDRVPLDACGSPDHSAPYARSRRSALKFLTMPALYARDVLSLNLSERVVVSGGGRRNPRARRSAAPPPGRARSSTAWSSDRR
jgi:hypothetical protein